MTRVTVTPADRAGWWTARVLFGARIVFETTRASQTEARAAAEAFVAQTR
jgi:hypothetical protein